MSHTCQRTQSEHFSSVVTQPIRSVPEAQSSKVASELHILIFIDFLLGKSLGFQHMPCTIGPHLSHLGIFRLTCISLSISPDRNVREKSESFGLLGMK